jgi:hypothetical protein
MRAHPTTDGWLLKAVCLPTPQSASAMNSPKRGSLDGILVRGYISVAGFRYANMADKAAKEKYPSWVTTDCNDGYIYSAPVGKFEANGFGLSHTRSITITTTRITICKRIT